MDKRLDIHNSNIPVVCRSCEARHKGVCGALTPQELTYLNKHTHKHTVEKGRQFLSEEEASQSYSNILRGVVKLTKLMSDGRQQIVGLQFAPDFLGRPFGSNNDVSAEAANELLLCSFPKSVFDQMVEETPALEHRLHEQALNQLDEARELMLTLGRKTAEEKVATFLAMIAEHLDPEVEVSEGPISFDLPLKRSDIADFLGLTIETVSRQITKLRKSGLIDIEGNRKITVRDYEALKLKGGS